MPRARAPVARPVLPSAASAGPPAAQRMGLRGGQTSARGEDQSYARRRSIWRAAAAGAGHRPGSPRDRTLKQPHHGGGPTTITSPARQGQPEAARSAMPRTAVDGRHLRPAPRWWRRRPAVLRIIFGVGERAGAPEVGAAHAEGLAYGSRSATRPAGLPVSLTSAAAGSPR